jgi:hypothetical protein
MREMLDGPTHLCYLFLLTSYPVSLSCLYENVYLPNYNPEILQSDTNVEVPGSRRRLSVLFGINGYSMCSGYVRFHPIRHQEP